MKIRFYFLISITMMILCQNLISQSIVNKEWELGFGLPDTIDVGATSIDNEENIYTTGNTIVAGQNANVLTTRYDKDGNMTWQKTYNYAGASKDYGTCITSDNNGYIYVAGASYINISHLTDYTILKYDTSGTLIWSTNFNGGNYRIDVPSAIVVDNNGNLYVTGASAGLSTKEDYLTIKLDNNGNILWDISYNYANLDDRPIGIIIDNQNDIIVTGFSYGSSNNCDITTVKYNSITGDEVSVIRDIQSGIGFDEPSQIKKDSNGNIIIAGYIATLTEGYNIKTVKFDNVLNQIWEQTYDGNGLNDKAKSMDIDLQGNIVITGYTTNQNNTKDIITIKYDNAGNQLWMKKRTTANQMGNCEAKKIKTDIAGNTYLLCEKFESGIKDILTIKYNNIGEKKWEKGYTSVNNEVINELKVTDNGEVYLTTKQDSSFQTIKYATYDKPLVPFYDSLGNPIYIKDEIIIRFDSSMVRRDAVDKVELQFGNASTFLKDIAIINVNTVLPPGFVEQATFIKVFTRMTTADSLSITRLGDTINVPPFWATFRMTIAKEGLEQEFMDSLNTLYPIVLNTEFNLIGNFTDVPNDIFIQQSYLEQLSLMPPLYYSGPVNHINMANHGYLTDDAWDFAVGDPLIKVGIFDTGIRYTHNDFNAGAPGSFNDSKIEDGWNYVANVHPSSMTNPDDYGHGTKCAGIIGAIRNNQDFIAGIAGGDLENSNTGVSLYDLKVGTETISTAALLPNVLNALYEGTTNFSLDICNFSLAFHESPSFTISELISLKEQIKFAFDNNICIVAARGNYWGQFSSVTDNMYPACYNDEMVIAVGASKSNGDWCDWEDSYTSMYGGNGAVDVIAPGVLSLVKTLDKDNDTDVSNFNGTSASTPHVVGTIGLMLSDFNIGKPQSEYLTPEDVEYILQYTALDKNTLGPDIETGHGLIDATSALLHLQPNNYIVLHPPVSNFQSSLNSQNQVIDLNYNYTNQIGDNIVASNYLTDIYEVTASGVNSNLGFLNNDYIVIDAWPLHSSSIGFKYTTLFDELIDYDNYIYIDNSDLQNQSTFSSYYYHLTYDNSNNISVDYWIPCNPNNANIDYSVYLQNNSMDIEEIKDSNPFAIYPNPTSENINIKFESEVYEDVNIVIYDISGEVILTKKAKPINEIIELNISNLQSSYYLLNIIQGDKSYFKKIIKI